MAAFNFPNSPSVNDTYSANGMTFTWNGTKWERTSPSVGAQGATGSTGPTGSTGAQGATAAQGAQGAAGAAGAQGATGSGGSTGSQGAAGAQGATAAAGAQGAAGAAGSQGAAGSNGGTDIVNDTSPQLGADLQSNGHHIQLSQEKYIKFGSTGTGIAGYSSGVYFEGNSTGATVFIRPKLNQESIKALPNGAVLLHHSGNQKLTTESDGVTVSGLMEANRTRNVPITTTERNALGTPDEGTIIYNSSTDKLQVYTDGAWLDFSGKEINVSGGTISNNGDRSGYVTHTFTSPGTFMTDNTLSGVEVMVIGGGGGGGGKRYGGGGGAGGVTIRTSVPGLSSPKAIVIGPGASGGGNATKGSNGTNSTFAAGTPIALTARGGGGGGCYDSPQGPGDPGGSGGGATSRSGNSGGSATQPGTNPSGTDYGNRGGNYAVHPNGYAACGGGGAGSDGIDTPGGISGGGNGGIGVQLSISGSATYYAGGGGGGMYGAAGPSNHYGSGGNGGGGRSNSSLPGSYTGGSPNQNGIAGSGGGGGGAHTGPNNITNTTGGTGGSGKVVIAYPTSQPQGTIVVN